MSVEEADILIVGGGPVGLSLAVEMSYRGMSCILIEKRRTTSNSPKALGINSRSMEQFRRLGLQDKIQDASYPRDMTTSPFFTTGVCKGNLIYRKPLSSWGEIVDGEKGTESFYFEEGCSVAPPMLCPQFTSEAVIYKHLQDIANNASVYWGWQVKSISQDDSGVQVRAVSEDADEKVFRGRYLVGADGGSSFVRKEVGLHMYGKFVVARACTVFFHSTQLTEIVKEKGYAGPGFVINPKIICFIAMLNVKGDFALHAFLPPSATDEIVDSLVNNPRRCIENALGCSDVPYNVIDVSGYNMHGLITTKFRVGRCFLAGDSAHQWLPAGGLGLNTGLSDVADLSWKLEALVKGYGGKYLADSYEIERRPLDDTTRRFAVSLGKFISNSGTRPIKILTRLLTSSFLFRLLARPLIRIGMAQMLSDGLKLVLGFQYSNSSIVCHHYNEDGSVTRKVPGKRFVQSSLPGCRAPHVVLPDCPTILDLFGKCFVILIIGGRVEADLEDLKDALRKMEVPFETHAYPPLPELVDLYDRKYFLVRPDGVIAWSSDYQPSAAESTKIISTVLGHVAPGRLPPFIMKFESNQQQHHRGFMRDAFTRFGVTRLLKKYAKMPLGEALGFGLVVSVLLRVISIGPPTKDLEGTSRHQAAVIDKYGSAGNVLRIEPKHMGKFGLNDVLIRVYSSSVNELDLQMRQGYGSTNFQKLSMLCKEGSSYFPLVLGRDCSGEVVAVGDGVTKFLPGDLVFAVVPPEQPGTHAQLVAVNERHVAFKPSNTDHKEAASLPWVAMTAWTALVKHVGLNPYNTRGKKVLVHQGTGGVSSFAIQLLKAWGANVTATCSTENTNLAHHLGVDKAVDDQTGDFSAIVKGFDVVFDPTGGAFEKPSLSVLKYYENAAYVCTNSPRQGLVDSLGGMLGSFVFSWVYRSKVIFNRLFGGRGFYYVDSDINGEDLDQVRALVECGAVRPLVDAVYSLDEIIDAHKHVESGQTRGKVVLSLP